MRFPESKVIEALREKYPAGCRVKLTKMDDVQAPPIGTLGTVDCVDDIGSIHVKWDIYCTGFFRKNSAYCQKSGILEIEKGKERLEKEC